MELLTCQHCGENTPSEYNFCVECEQQIRCLDSSCGKAVYPGKEMCFGCGKSLTIKIANNQAPNHFVRKVKQSGNRYEEHTELSVSNDAVSVLAPLFGSGQFMPIPRQQQATVTKRPINNIGQGNLFALTPELSSDAPVRENGIDEQKTTEGPSELTSSKSPLSSYFTKDGDLLVPRQRDFKGESWKHQQQNFIVLYTGAYNEIYGKPVPDRSHFKQAAAKAKIMDSHNFATYVTKTIGRYMQEITGGFVLGTDGDKEVLRIVKLMDNENSEEGYNYWDRSSSGSVERIRLTNEDKTKVKSWLADDVNLGQLDIRDASSAKEYALIAFWILNSHLKKANSIKWNEASLYLTSKFDTISVTGQAFRAAVVGNEDLFNFNNANDTHYITPTGEKMVESWVIGTVKIKADK